MLKAIETRYGGCAFRSRTEARYAVLMDALGVRWEYEVEGFELPKLGWYLPDFWLPDLKWWVEIKGAAPTAAEKAKAAALRDGGFSVVIFSGQPAALPGYGYWTELGDDNGGNAEGAVSWQRCGRCGAVLLVPNTDLTKYTLFRADMEECLQPACDCGLDRYERWTPLDGAILTAAVKARSARFEHGASGYVG